jgi:hypothetical protein
MLSAATLPVPASLMAVLTLFSGCFTAPGFRTFCALVAGLAAQTGRRTICGMIVGAGLGGLVRHERFHRFFSAAAWCPDELGLTVARMVADLLLPPGADLVVLVDDTLLKRWGKKVFGVFWTHDGAAQGKTKLGRGNRWVVAAIVVHLPFTTVPVGIPVLARLWRGKNTAPPTELARDMVLVLRAAFPGMKIHCVGDAAYHSPVLKDLPAGVSWMCRLAKNVVLQGPVPPRTGRRGAPRKRGDRLGTCAEIAATAIFLAHRLTVYGQTAKVSIAQVTGQWYTVFGTTPVRIILIRDDAARDGKPCHLGLVTTDTTTSTAAADLMVRYATRWSIEVIFSQLRNLLGAGQARNRVQAAVERTFPFQLIVYSIVIVWYALHACSDTDVRQRRLLCPWYRTKTAPSYEDMLTKLRLALAEARFSAITPGQRPPHENPIALVTLASAAA